MKRVLVISAGLSPYEVGGIQKHTRNLVYYLSMNGIEVTLMHSNTVRDNYKSAFGNDMSSIKTIMVKPPRLLNFPGYYSIWAIFLSYRFFNSSNYQEFDVIYAQGLVGYSFAKSRKARRKLVSNLHGLEMFQDQGSLFQNLRMLPLKYPARTIIKYSNKSVSLGGHLSVILFKNGAEMNSIIELSNGIDLSWVKSTEDVSSNNSNTRKFVFIGRYEYRKGIVELNTVLTSLLNKESFTFEFIGPIPKKRQLSSSNIRYHGKLTDENSIKEILDSADVLVAPSYAEGMPTVILEAMSRGCAIITTDVGANQLLCNRLNGILIESRNVEQLKNAIVSMVRIPEPDLRKMKLASIRLVGAKYVWPEVSRLTIEALLK